MDVPRKDTGYVDNWQAGKTVTECNLHMLTSKDFCDVIFHVGSEKHLVRAHRYVLVSRSCVFQAMFCGPLAEKGEVTVPDIEPDVFREFLRYLYTDTATLTADNVTGLLYTSRKYAVDALQDMCVSFLDKSLSEDNVCQILEYCHSYGESDLEQKALKILTEAGVNVIKSTGFLELCSNCLKTFLKSANLNLKEEDVFKAAFSWAKATCEAEGVSLSPAHIRKYIGDLRYEIHFTDLSLEYLVNVVAPSGIITDVERFRIIDRSVNPSIDISPFKHGPRKTQVFREHYVHVFSEVYEMAHEGITTAVSFNVNKNITVLGFQVCGLGDMQQVIFRFSVLLYDDQDRVIARPVQNPTYINCTRMKETGNDDQRFNFKFNHPVPVVSWRTYHIVVPTLSNGCQLPVCGKINKTPVTVDGVTFTFRKSKYCEICYWCNEVQIAGLIWN